MSVSGFHTGINLHCLNIHVLGMSIGDRNTFFAPCPHHCCVNILTSRIILVSIRHFYVTETFMSWRASVDHLVQALKSGITPKWVCNRLFWEILTLPVLHERTLLCSQWLHAVGKAGFENVWFSEFSFSRDYDEKKNQYKPKHSWHRT